MQKTALQIETLAGDIAALEHAELPRANHRLERLTKALAVKRGSLEAMLTCPRDFGLSEV
ncbi:hypothetical protein [Acidisoma sp. L85]|uniref:hypothetical protein n=1 Tax=Acidisoma sp. L85 TaxID=1641850 RepID=UPI00131E8ABD|nr:hypothetical protein [Acidisoma sp. L85]